MDETKKSGTPTWVWLIVALGVLTVIGVCVVIAVAIGFFVIADSNRVETTGPAEAIVEVFTEEPPASPTTPPTLPPTNTVPPATDTPEVTGPTDTPPAEASATEPAGDTADDPNAALRESIEGNVSAIRGLDPLVPVTTTILTRDELRARVEEDLFAELTPEDAADFSLLLHAFDFVDRDFDYYNFTLDLYAEQIAGFYDPETDEFVVVSDDDDLDVGEQLTHAHEFVHALQDQYYALDLLDDESLDSEASTALLALIEGEATLVQGLYLLEGYFTFEELNEFLTLSTTQESPVFDSAPPVLANNLLFPYTAGYEFAQYLYDQNGFAALDTAWADPPVSTEQILHPERYLAADLPQIVSLAPLTDTLGTEWRLLDEDVFGEFFLNEYITQQLPDTQANTAAEGWGGDQYAVYYNDGADQLVMTLRLAWDTPADADEFAIAYTEYLNALYGTTGQSQADGGVCWSGADFSCLYTTGEETFIVRAPDITLVQAVVTAQP
jgi:hypothetical protein